MGRLKRPVYSLVCFAPKRLLLAKPSSPGCGFHFRFSSIRWAHLTERCIFQKEKKGL
jgi:hypothetical protein